MPPRSAPASSPASSSASSASASSPAASKSAPPRGFARLYAPAHINAASYDGEVYVVEDGSIDVPQGAVRPLVEHGFSEKPLEAPAAEPIADDAETSE